MSYSVTFDVPFECLACGTTAPARDADVHAFFPNPVSASGWVRPGDVLSLHPDDFEVAFRLLRAPAPGEDVRVLESFRCPSCTATQWVLLEFRPEAAERYRFLGGRSIELTDEVKASAHYVSELAAI